MPRITFVMEQHLGHQTYYQNLRRFIDGDPLIRPTWARITYTKPGGMIERLKFLSPKVRGTLRGRQQVRAALGSTPADLVFYNTQVPAALAGRLRDRTPAYALATDLTPMQYDAIGTLYGHRPDHFEPLKKYKQRVNEEVFRGAARLLPWSSWAADSLINDYGVDPHRVDVLPPGVDLALWRPMQKQETGPLRVLFVGGDFERKGGQTLLRAFDSLPPGETELHLVTRTVMPNAPGLKVYNNLQPNSPELIALYQQCDVFVLPTGAEAFGIAAVEACAVGLPIIATRTGGLSDIVVHEETGYFIPSSDKDALATRLRSLAQNAELRQRLAFSARARAETKFDAKKNATRLAAALIEASEQR